MKTITAKEVYEKCLDNRGEELGFILTPAMVAAAIWYAEGKIVTAYGNRVSNHLKAQRERAEKCRYHRMAKHVLGQMQYKDVIYHPSYGEHFEIGAWDFQI